MQKQSITENMERTSKQLEQDNKNAAALQSKLNVLLLESSQKDQELLAKDQLISQTESLLVSKTKESEFVQKELGTRDTLIQGLENETATLQVCQRVSFRYLCG